jgi:hypothetical protein
MRAIDLQITNKSIDFFFVDEYGLTELANHEGRSAEKKTEEEAMNLNYSEYVYHFLGKNKEPTEKRSDHKRFKVSTKDFVFMKILGTGGFSKVLLID